MTWFDFHDDGATVFINSEFIVAITEVGSRTELALSNGGAVTVDESIAEVTGAMFEKVGGDDTFTASESEEENGGEV